jgi:hypothetical protein
MSHWCSLQTFLNIISRNVWDLFVVCRRSCIHYFCHNVFIVVKLLGSPSSIVSSDTVLQAGRLWASDEVFGLFFNWYNPSSCIMVLGSTYGGKGQAAHEADISQPSTSQLSGKCGILDISQAYGSPRPVTGIALFFYFIFFFWNCDNLTDRHMLHER